MAHFYFAKQEVRVALICALLILVGGLIRYFSIFDWSVANNEYYSTASALKIWLAGSTAYECGIGTYSRAPFYHYVASLFVGAFPDWRSVEAVRLFSALANTFTIPAVFLIGWRVRSVGTGLLAAVLFMLSMWEIEFSRFARMYAVFACFSTWSIYFFLRYVSDQSIRHLIFVLGFAICGALSWAGGMFLLCLPVLAWWLTTTFPSFKEIVLVAAAGLIILIAKELTASPAVGPTGEGASIILDPFQYLNRSYHLAVALGLFLTGLATLAMFRRRLFAYSLHWYAWLGIAVVFVAGCLGFVLPAALAAAALLLSESLANDTRKRMRFALLLGCFLAAVSFVHVVATVIEGHAFHKAVIGLIRFPEVWHRLVIPWSEPMPIWTAVLVIASLALSTYCLVRPAHLVLRSFLVCLLLFVALTTTVNTDYNATRYSFWIYPLFFVSVAACAGLLIERFASTFKWLLYPTFGIALFAVSDDHSINDLTQLYGYEQAYRVGMQEQRAKHYYMRDDYQSAADFLENNASDVDYIVLTHQAQSMEVGNFDAVYRKNPVENRRNSCAGNIDRWTGKVLHTSVDDILALAKARSVGAVWILDHGYTPAISRSVMEKDTSVKFELAYTAPDEKSKILKLSATAL